MTGLRAVILGLGLAALAGCATTLSVPRPVPRVVLDAHVREIHAVAFSPDGALFASAGGGSNPAADEITLWTTATGERRMTFADLKGVVSSLAFSPDGRQVAAVHHAGWSPIPNHCPYVYVFDARTGRILLRSPRPFDERRGLAIAHDGKLLARGVDGGFELWDLKTMEERTTVSGPSSKMQGAELLVFSPDDQTLVSSDRRGHLLLWDVSKLAAATAGAVPAQQ